VRAQGRYPEAEKLSNDALAIERHVLAPDHPETATAIYNVACIAALQGRSDEAFTLLREAVEHGLSPGEDLRIASDPDLKALHGDPRFETLVADARKRAAAAKAS
jgi:tetratricopeptide repeat protein